MFILMKSGLGLCMGHLGSKTRSQGQIIGKPCVDDRGLIFDQFSMKCGQTEIWLGIVYGSS